MLTGIQFPSFLNCVAVVDGLKCFDEFKYCIQVT